MALKACAFLIEIVAQRKGPMMLAILPRMDSEYC